MDLLFSIAFDSQSDYNRHWLKHREKKERVMALQICVQHKQAALERKQHNEMTQSRGFV